MNPECYVVAYKEDSGNVISFQDMFQKLKRTEYVGVEVEDNHPLFQ